MEKYLLGCGYLLACGFCNKTQKEVAKLVQGATGAVICDECLVVVVAKMVGSPVKFQEPIDDD